MIAIVWATFSLRAEGRLNQLKDIHRLHGAEIKPAARFLPSMKNLKAITQLAGLAITVGLALTGLTSTAQAQLIGLNFGNFTINANGYSASTITSQAPGALPTTAGPLEDSWGIFQVTSVLNGAVPTFTDNGGSEYWGMYYNSYDTAATPLGSGNLAFTSLGLKLDIFKVNVLDAGDSLFATVYNQGTAGRISANQYNGISNAGTLVLSSVLSGTMQSFYVASNGSTFATGNLDVTYNNMFGTNGGNLGPLSFALSGLTSAVPSNWTVKYDGPIAGAVFTPVPEASTYGIMAGAMITGVVALRRRQRAAGLPAAA